MYARGHGCMYARVPVCMHVCMYVSMYVCMILYLVVCMYCMYCMYCIVLYCLIFWTSDDVLAGFLYKSICNHRRNAQPEHLDIYALLMWVGAMLYMIDTSMRGQCVMFDRVLAVRFFGTVVAKPLRATLVGPTACRQLKSHSQVGWFTKRPWFF